MSAASSPSSSVASSESGDWDDCPGYDRNLIIQELTSLYTLLTRIHIHPADLLIPPDRGWLELTDKLLQPLGKTARANDLIRHLPYVRRENHRHNGIFVWHETVCVDYRSEEVLDALREGKDPDVDAHSEWWATPPHVVSIMGLSATKYGHWILLDTERGTVSVVDYMTGPDHPALDYKDYRLGAQHPDSEMDGDAWQDFSAISMTDFCEMVKQDWRTLQLIPTSRVDYETRDTFDEATLAEFQEIFISHGWLNENYRRQECLAASRKLAKEHGCVVLEIPEEDDP